MSEKLSAVATILHILVQLRINHTKYPFHSIFWNTEYSNQKCQKYQLYYTPNILSKSHFLREKSSLPLYSYFISQSNFDSVTITMYFISNFLITEHRILVPPLYSSSIYRGELSFLQPVHFCICWRHSAVLTGYLFRQWPACVCVPNWKNNVLGVELRRQTPITIKNVTSIHYKAYQRISSRIF